MSGKFITLEGGEGAGKSTQIRLLADWLKDQGKDVVMTREPGGTPEAEKIRALLVDRDGGNWSPLVETMMMFAARAMHVRDLIQPALDEGKIVICDRFTDSTRAYQGYAGGMNLLQIEELKRISIGKLEPHLTFIMDIPVKIGLERSLNHNKQTGSTEDRMENKDIVFHEALRAGFIDIAKNNPGRCSVVNAERSIEEIHDAIKEVVNELI